MLNDHVVETAKLNWEVLADLLNATEASMDAFCFLFANQSCQPRYVQNGSLASVSLVAQWHLGIALYSTSTS